MYIHTKGLNVPVVSFINSKGGAGKSTLAIHTARSLQLKGYSVLVVDSDKQATCVDWAEISSEDYFPVVGLADTDLEKPIKQLKTKYDYIVIDGAAKANKSTLSAIKASDLVILPVRPSPVDVWATRDVVEIIEARQEITDGWPVAGFLRSIVTKNTITLKKVEAALEEMPFSSLEQTYHKKEAYLLAMSDGLTAMETSKEAAEEINNITSEIEEFFKNGTT